MSNDQTIRSFNAFLGSLEDGRMHTELTEQLTVALSEMHDAALDRGGKAKSKISISIDLKLEDGVVEASGEFKVTLPKAARGRTIFWETPEGNLSRANPKQAELFRDVTSAREPVRDVTA